MYKDGDVQNAMLRNEAVEWLDKPATSARSSSPQKARSKVSSGATSHADGASPTSKPRPCSKGPGSPLRKRSRLQNGPNGTTHPARASRSGQSVRRASTGQDSCAPSASTQSEHQTSSRPGVCFKPGQASDMPGLYRGEWWFIHLRADGEALLSLIHI